MRRPIMNSKKHSQGFGARFLLVLTALMVIGGYLAKQQLETALPLPLRSIVAILGGAGDLGMFADAGDREDVRLVEGPNVPAKIGSHPLIAKPLPGVRRQMI